jgi:phosphohistidine phosphatase
MKTLYLLRHAKSSPATPIVKDFERSLSVRGLEDITLMAENFNECHLAVQSIISSSAKRANHTATIMAEKIGFSSEDVTCQPELYLAGVSVFLRITSLIDDRCEAAMLVGHNPTITEFANRMTNSSIDSMPTCSLVKLSLPIICWSDVELGQGIFLKFEYPKNLRESNV